MSASVTPPRKRYRIVAVISGPEPQRTMLDQVLTDSICNQYRVNICLCAGCLHNVRRSASATSPHYPI